jgi:hypothetical protein
MMMTIMPMGYNPEQIHSQYHEINRIHAERREKK